MFRACTGAPTPRTLAQRMAWKRKVTGSFLAVAGYLLSPLSWWNDAFINLPLAVLFAWMVSVLYKPAFEAAVVVGYWLTNVAGFVLMHKGTQKLMRAEDKPYGRRDFLKDLAVSLAYTGLILLLLRLGVLKPLQNYFPSRAA